MTRPGTIEVKFKWTREEFVRIYMRSLLRRRFYIPVGGVAFALLAYAEEDIGGFGLWLLILLSVLFIPALAFWKAYAAMKKNRVSQNEIRFGFSGKGLDFFGAGVYSHVDWTNIRSVMETGGRILFYVTRTKGYSVPTRAFTSLSEQDAVRRLIRAHARGKVRLRH
jgi:YcxB-like protein